MESILYILTALLSGMAFGWLGRRQASILRAAGMISMLSIYFLLFFLGAGLGADRELLSSLPELGLKASVTAVFAVAGSILLIWLLTLTGLFANRARGPAQAEQSQGTSPLAGTLRILAAFGLGVGLSWLGYLPAWTGNSSLVTYALYIMVFAVGIGLGSDLQAFGIVREMHVKIFAVPVLIILGTLSGSVAAAACIPGYAPLDALCVGAGLGYYSLSSILIESSGNPSLATVALIANIFREVLTLLFTPVLSKYCAGLAPVAAAGATAMDTCLPGIARYCGERNAIIAVFSGTVLTIAVSFLVAGLLHWKSLEFS